MSLIEIRTLHLHFHGTTDPSFLNPVIARLDKIIMANEDIKAQLTAAEEGLAQANAQLSEVKAEQTETKGILVRVGDETSNSLAEIQTLLDIIAGLQNPDPELAEQAARVKAATDALKVVTDEVKVVSGEVKGAAAGVDAQVPDTPV